MNVLKDAELTSDPPIKKFEYQLALSRCFIIVYNEIEK